MNKHIKMLLLPALAAVAFAGVSVGATFALFTDKAEASIEIESGKIKVSSTISDFVTYSAEANANGDRIDENGYKYISKQTEVAGVFTNGGLGGYEGSHIALARITPGDRVTFNIGLGDESNVTFKYRVVYKVVSQDTTLAKALVTKANFTGEEETYAGLLEFTSTWETAPVTGLGGKSFSFDIELPIDKSNNYQDKSVDFVFSVEAVQGNAYTENVDAKTLTGIEDLSQNAVAEAGEPVVIEVANGEDEDKTFGLTATLPADLVDAGDKVELLVSDAEMDVTTSAQATLDFDITLKVNDTAVSQFDEEITVEIYVGEGLDADHMQVFHAGTEINNWSYDEDTGIITFTTSSFSPFVVKYQMPIIGGGASMIEEEEEF